MEDKIMHLETTNPMNSRLNKNLQEHRVFDNKMMVAVAKEICPLLNVDNAQYIFEHKKLPEHIAVAEIYREQGFDNVAVYEFIIYEYNQAMAVANNQLKYAQKGLRAFIKDKNKVIIPDIIAHINMKEISLIGYRLCSTFIDSLGNQYRFNHYACLWIREDNNEEFYIYDATGEPKPSQYSFDVIKGHFKNNP